MEVAIMKIAAVVVTYNRKEKLIKNLSCLKNQTRSLDKIYVIDNASTDGTKEIFNSTSDELIEYIRLDKNLGGSGGFAIGIEKAYNEGFDYIWGMDDDAFPDIKALEELEKASQEFDELTSFWSNCDNDDDFENEYKKVDSWMFVGFFIPKKVIEKVGFPRSDFFIYHDDSEYAYRIIKKGYKIIKVKKSLINHKDYNKRENIQKNFFRKTIQFPKIPDWRMYYLVRNHILMYNWNDLNKYKTIFYYLPKIFLKLIILSIPQKKVFLKAMYHGIINKTGKVMQP